MVEQPYPGSGGRHRKTDTYGKKTDLSKTPRNELAKDILDLRSIYRSDDLYGTRVKEGLREVIKRNKEDFPVIFEKSK